jgi:hypothetical protein
MIRSNRKTLLVAASLLLMCGLFAQAYATTLVRMDLKSLARSAEIIVRARCIHSETRWESGSIWTFDDFEVLEIFKGASPLTLRVRLPGGRIAHTETKIDGVPMFAAGEETVLFVEPTSAGDYGVTSWAQGTFRVHRNANSEARVTQDTSHFAVFDPHTREFAAVGVRNLPISEFRQQLAEAISAPVETKQQPFRSKP